MISIASQSTSDCHSLQDLATEIDEFDTVGIHAHVHGRTLSDWLNGSVSDDTLTKAESGFIGQVCLSYELLDMLAWAYGWPTHPLHLNQPAILDRRDCCSRQELSLTNFCPPAILSRIFLYTA